MKASHLEFIVEEPSIEAFLAGLMPRMLGTQTTFSIHPHQGKMDLLNKLSLTERVSEHERRSECGICD